MSIKSRVTSAGLRLDKTVLHRAVNRVDMLRFARHVSVRPCSGLIQLGTEYGGRVLPIDLPQVNWVCYSGGIGEDASFELELVARYGCVVVGFDPTPRSIEYIRTVAAQTPEFRFLPVGLWSFDTEQRFYAPENPAHVSHSITSHGSGEYFTAKCRSVPSLMAELGHEQIDLLKLDIEGAEYEVLGSVLDANVRVKILLVEFHKTGSLKQMTSMVDRIERAGYRAVHRDRSDLTFVDSAFV